MRELAGVTFEPVVYDVDVAHPITSWKELAGLDRLAARSTRNQMLARLHSRERVTLKTPAAVVIREERESA